MLKHAILGQLILNIIIKTLALETTGIAPLYAFSSSGVDGARFAETLTSNLNKHFFPYNYILIYLGQEEKTFPQTENGAADWCQEHQIKYLLYGTITLEEQKLEATIHFFDASAADVQFTVIEQMSKDMERQLVDLISFKIYSAMLDEFPDRFPRISSDLISHYTPPNPIENSRLNLSSSLGWGIPLNEWSNPLAGLIVARASGMYNPQINRDSHKKLDFFWRFGTSLSYSLGFNRDGYEEFYLGIFQIGIPLDAILEFKGRHQLRITFSPTLNIENLRQNKKYDSWQNSSGLNAGMQIMPAYIFQINEIFSLGLVNTLDISFTYPLRII